MAYAEELPVGGQIRQGNVVEHPSALGAIPREARTP